MKTTNTISGQKYLYKISLSGSRNHYNFTVKAIDKQTKRTSFINTVNPLLSQLGIELSDNRYWESDWLLTKKELNSFYKKIKNILRNKEYLIYFESYLDQDRDEGEWENIDI